MASLGLHFQWRIPLPTAQLGEKLTLGGGLQGWLVSQGCSQSPSGHGPQWWWSEMGEISGGPVGKYFSSEGTTVWTHGRPGLLPGTRYLQAFLQVLIVALGVLPPLLYPHSILHLERTLHLGLRSQLVQSPRASAHPTSGKPSFLPPSLICSPPLPFTPLVSPTHSHRLLKPDF